MSDKWNISYKHKNKIYKEIANMQRVKTIQSFASIILSLQIAD